MTTQAQTSFTFNLYTNFLTRSYFDLIEKWLHYLQHVNPSSSDARAELLRKVDAFTFLLAHTKSSSFYLDAYIFQNLSVLSYDHKHSLIHDLKQTHPNAFSLLHLPRTRLSLPLLKKCYLKTYDSLLRANETALLYDYNTLVVQLFFSLALLAIPDKNTPPYLLVTTLEDFTNALYRFKEASTSY